MMGTYKIILNLLLAAGFTFYAVCANALALSDAQLKSHLNQSLDVRIELKAADAAELNDLRIILSQVGDNTITRYQFKYELITGSEGNYLKITTHDVVREPIIEFTLDIGWSDGHVVREYSFLIDPPQN